MAHPFDPFETIHPDAASFLTRPVDDAEAAHLRARLDDAARHAPPAAARAPYYDPDLGGIVDPSDPEDAWLVDSWAKVRATQARARAASLDTGATSRHRDPAERDRDRMRANDRAKAELVPVIRRAAGQHRAGEPCSCSRAYLDANPGTPTHEHGCAVAERGWLDGRASALEGCRDVRAYRDAGCGAYTARPKSCRVRLCPDCERARASRMVGRLSDLALDMRRPVFWTFTVPNVAPGQLARGVDWLLDSFRALRRRAIIRGGRCRDCGGTHQPVAGGVYSIEVTRGKDGRSWHPHTHVLMDAPWLLQGEVRDAWRAVTCDAIRKLETGAGKRGRKVGDGARPARLPRCAHRADDKGRPLDGCRGASIVWVSRVDAGDDPEQRRRAIRETLKYATGGLVKDGKLADGIGPVDVAELLFALRNRRLVAGWGDWRHVQDDDPDDELPEGDTVLVDTGARNAAGLTIWQRMPARCPHCTQPALWELPIVVPRAACSPGPAGLLGWRPGDRPPPD